MCVLSALGTLCKSHSFTPKMFNDSHQLLISQQLYMSCEAILQFSPHLYHYIHVRTTGLGWSPLCSLFLNIAFAA